MKITVEMDCTPVEARTLMGLPDVTKLNEEYLQRLSGLVSGGSSLEQVQELGKLISPLGNAGLKIFQQLIDAAGSGIVSSSGKPGKPGKSG